MAHHRLDGDTTNHKPHTALCDLIPFLMPLSLCSLYAGGGERRRAEQDREERRRKEKRGALIKQEKEKEGEGKRGEEGATK